MSETRALLESSFRTALLRLDVKPLPGDEVPASLAGHYLQIAGGDAERAIALTLHIDTSKSLIAHRLYAAARSHLAKVLEEERSERGPRLQTG